MAVKKREWVTKKGEQKSAWVVDYYDSNKKRRLKTFRLKKEADAFAAGSKIELIDGTHIPDRESVTVDQAGKLWLQAAEESGLERTSIDQYSQHLRLHIVPFIGAMKLNKLTVDVARKFEGDLRHEGRSPMMVKKVLVSLGTLLTDAQDRGLVTHNVIRERKKKKSASTKRPDQRAKPKLKIGVDVPTNEEIAAILSACPDRYKNAITVAALTGMRASEIRGLTSAAVNLTGKTKNGIPAESLHVFQRMDRYNTFGPPKSTAGNRYIELVPEALDALKDQIANRPANDDDLVFPNLQGGVQSHTQLQRDGYEAAQIAAGLTVDSGKKDKKGRPILKPKYPGLHALRHWFASWCINSTKDDGRGFELKKVQTLLGHDSIVMTGDVYGHMFQSSDDREERYKATAFLRRNQVSPNSHSNTEAT